MYIKRLGKVLFILPAIFVGTYWAIMPWQEQNMSLALKFMWTLALFAGGAAQVLILYALCYGIYLLYQWVME